MERGHENKHTHEHSKRANNERQDIRGDQKRRGEGREVTGRRRAGGGPTTTPKRGPTTRRYQGDADRTDTNNPGTGKHDRGDIGGGGGADRRTTRRFGGQHLATNTETCSQRTRPPGSRSCHDARPAALSLPPNAPAVPRPRLTVQGRDENEVAPNVLCRSSG